MQVLIKSAIISAAALLTSPAVFADNGQQEFQASFRYDAKAPVSEIYDSAERTALDACETERDLVLARQRLQRECSRDLLDTFIAKVGNIQLAEIHRVKTGRVVEIARSFAARAKP